MSETVMENQALGFRLEHRDNNGDTLQVNEGPLDGEAEGVQAVAPGGVLDYSVTFGRGVVVLSAARPEAPTRVTVNAGAEQVMCVRVRRDLVKQDGDVRAHCEIIQRELTEEGQAGPKGPVTSFKHFDLDRDTALVIVTPGEEAILNPFWAWGLQKSEVRDQGSEDPGGKAKEPEPKADGAQKPKGKAAKK